MADATERETALRSALGRLPVAIFLVDERPTLRPLNGRATDLIDSEGLGGDMVEARPAHPLSRLIRQIQADDRDPSSRNILVFPSGTHYSVEASRRSEKGKQRWLVLIIERVAADSPSGIEARLLAWDLTTREREVASMMIDGAPTERICKKLGIAPTTLKTHIKRILHKSGATTRADFLAKVIAARKD